MKQPQVIISHPGRQHSHQTAYALQEGGLLKRCYTSLWYKPDEFPYSLINYLPQNIRGTIKEEFKKRGFEPIDKNLVEQIPIYELIGQMVKLFSKPKYGKFIYWINEKFDKKVSKKIQDLDFDVFMGYETSALRSFTTCKKLGKITVLDLAAEHGGKQEEIWEMINYDPYGGEGLRKRIDSIKDEELRLADYIFTPSDYAKQTLLDAGISEGKLIKIPYGANPDVFKPKERYRKHGSFKILYVGAISIRKGLKYILEAYKKLALKDSELILIGGMADGRDLLDSCRGLYRYIPFVSQEELASFYQDSDIFVFPSLLDSFAMVVPEAMVCGTPAIVSENTGAKDLIKNGENGYIIPVMDTESLIERIRWFYENRDKVEEFGRNARRQAEEYTWEMYRERVREAIHEIWIARNK